MQACTIGRPTVLRQLSRASSIVSAMEDRDWAAMAVAIQAAKESQRKYLRVSTITMLFVPENVHAKRALAYPYEMSYLKIFA
jgi:hypothetical protein